MEKIVLKAVKRNVTGKQVKALRRSGQLPAVIYGRHVEPIAISLEAHTANLVLSKLTSSTLVTVDVEGREYAALVREKQRNYIKGYLTHVDLLALDLTEKIRTKVQLTFTGVAPAVKAFSAVLVHRMEAFEVECLPTDLPERISVDISSINEIGDNIRVSAIPLPENVVVLEDADEIVIIATLAKEEKEPVAAEEGTVVPGAEVVAPSLSVERGKKEEEAAEKK
jgi:large subunit ribosomal protein L25